MKQVQFVFDGYELVNPSQWCVSFDVPAHAFVLTFFQRQKVYCSLSVSVGVHMFGSEDQVAIVLQL